MTTQEDLRLIEEIAERTKLASPGPWGVLIEDCELPDANYGPIIAYVEVGNMGTSEMVADLTPHLRNGGWEGSGPTEAHSIVIADAEFIAHARQDIPWLLARLAKLEAVAEARDVFLAASVTVWREIDRLADEHGTYPGLPESVAIRRAEKAAWERYRDVLDSTL